MLGDDVEHALLARIEIGIGQKCHDLVHARVVALELLVDLVDALAMVLGAA